MIKLSDKSRRVLRRIYQGLGAATISILFQACYGMPLDDDVNIGGIVNSNTNVPIPGIKVSIKNLSPAQFTNEDGVFNIIAPRKESYKIKFEDIDGPLNGSYRTLERKINLSEINTSLQIHLDEE